MSFSPKTPPISTVYDSLELQGRQIRLLEIISTSPEIICKLQVAQLEHDLAFSALSYVWGNPEATRGISVNGIRIQVTTNLASALECAPGHLRQAGVAAKLWVDAVCINQDDADEKNHQVPLMADVYSSAQLVLCWFGPANESIHKSMDWVELVARERPSRAADDKNDRYLASLRELRGIPSEAEGLTRLSVKALQAFKEGFSEKSYNTPVDIVRRTDVSSLIRIVTNASHLIDAALSELDSVRPATQAWVDEVRGMIPIISFAIDDLETQKSLLEICPGLEALENPADPETQQTLLETDPGGLEDLKNKFQADSDQLRSMVSRLEDDVHKMYSLLKRDNYTRNLAWLQKYPELINWEGSRPEESCGLMAALDLFDLPYWSRAWIFQEVVLPKQPVFVCGNRSLSLASLQTFERWMWWFTILPAPTRPDFFPSTVWALMTNTNYYGFKRIRRVFKARKAVFHAADTASEAASAKSDNGADNSAWDDWSVSTTCMASEPKDYIYSFLAISGLGLVPDYRPEKSVGQVCREFLLEYVREYRRKGSGEDRRGELHLLRFAGVGNGWRMYLDTPSWAPNFPGMCWTRHNDRKSMGLGMNSEKQVDGEAEMFHSCAKAEFVAEKLVVAAVILDAVQAAGPLRGDFGDVDTILQREGPMSWSLDFAMGRREYVTGCHPLWAIYHALRREMAPSTSDTSQAPMTLVKVLCFWFLYVQHDSSSDDGDLMDRRRRYLEDVRGDIESQMSDDRTQALDEQIYNCIAKSDRLAETKHGYIGLFPRNVEVGDVVCLVNGLPHLSVLRRVKDDYVFVGTCFILGLDDMTKVKDFIAGQCAGVERVKML